MGNRIDVLMFLAQVLEENTTGYRSDFQYDVRMLTQAAQEKDMKDRVFYWMSRPNGTWCVKEREVFLQGSGAHSIWTYYADQPEGIRAYRVTITGMEGQKVMGQVIPLDYKTQVRRVQEQAIPATALTLQYESGHTIVVPYDGHQASLNTVRPGHGTIRTVRYEPDNEAELTRIIMVEHRHQTGKVKEPLQGAQNQTKRKPTRR